MAAGASDVKLYFPGSWQQTGIQSHYNDRAQVLGRVKNLTFSSRRARINEAISAVLEIPGILVHPHIEELPLQYVRAKLWGKKAQVHLEYFRNRFDRWRGPGSYPVAQFRRVIEPVECYRDVTSFDSYTGLPAGDTYLPTDAGTFTNPEKPPRVLRRWIYQRPAQRIYLSALLPYNPQNVVGPLGMTINSDNVTLGPLFYEAETIRFDGADITWTTRRTSAPAFGGGIITAALFFEVQYVFTALFPTLGQVNRWYGQFPKYVDGSWTVRNLRMHASASFAGAFPV